MGELDEFSLHGDCVVTRGPKWTGSVWVNLDPDQQRQAHYQRLVSRQPDSQTLHSRHSNHVHQDLWAPLEKHSNPSNVLSWGNGSLFAVFYAMVRGFFKNQFMSFCGSFECSNHSLPRFTCLTILRMFVCSPRHWFTMLSLFFSLCVVYNLCSALSILFTHSFIYISFLNVCLLFFQILLRMYRITCKKFGV